MATVGIVAGRVLKVWSHPNADRIFLALVDIGDQRPLQIVFGGSRRLQAGEVIPVAPPGARLPGINRMRRRRYRGEDSYGMFCSLDELGWAKGAQDEVAVLDGSLLPGTSLDEIPDPLSIVISPRVHG
jgi:phenylalanyl-tRNA synthetase beta chain